MRVLELAKRALRSEGRHDLQECQGIRERRVPLPPVPPDGFAVVESDARALGVAGIKLERRRSEASTMNGGRLRIFDDGEVRAESSDLRRRGHVGDRLP